MEYVYQPYPKMLYHAEFGQKVVENAAEQEALGEGWVNNPDLISAPKSDASSAEAQDQESTEQQEEQSSSGESVAPITIVEMTKAQLIEALRALGQTANATMSKDTLTEKLQKAQSQE